MKINLAKLARIVGQIVAAAPVIIAAVRPVLNELKKPSKTPGDNQRP